jgi:hypothetical protein
MVSDPRDLGKHVARRRGVRLECLTHFLARAFFSAAKVPKMPVFPVNRRQKTARFFDAAANVSYIRVGLRPS